MKNIFIKTVIPAIAILLAIGGSFVTQSAEKKAEICFPGFAPTYDPNPCIITTTCSNMLGSYFTALVGSEIVRFYGKISPGAVTCLVTVYQCP